MSLRNQIYEKNYINHYVNIHIWLKKYHGKAYKCESKQHDPSKPVYRYEWVYVKSTRIL
jgi:hypothetical protein